MTFTVLIVVALLAVASFILYKRRQTRRSHYWSMSDFIPVTPRLSFRYPNEKVPQRDENDRRGLNDEYSSSAGEVGIAPPLGPSGQPLPPSGSAFHLPMFTNPFLDPLVPTPAPNPRPSDLSEPNPFTDPSRDNHPQEQPPKQDIISVPFPTSLPAAPVIFPGLQPAGPAARPLAEEPESAAHSTSPLFGNGILKNAFNHASSGHALNMRGRVTRLLASTDALRKDILKRAAASSVMSSGKGVGISSADDGPLAIGGKGEFDLRPQSIQSNITHGSLLNAGSLQSSSVTPSAIFQAGPDLEGRPQPDVGDNTSGRSFFSRLRESRRSSPDST